MVAELVRWFSIPFDGVPSPVRVVTRVDFVNSGDGSMEFGFHWSFAIRFGTLLERNALMVRIIAGILDNFRRCKGLVRRSWCFSGGIVIVNSAMAIADVYSNLAGVRFLLLLTGNGD
nr:hypothetical protein Iba_scaffold59620CG0010 [Ipomoea batatas]GMC91993.1 hypothetical protein Iba_chr05aCG6830 [Ipomoea batatas]